MMAALSSRSPTHLSVGLALLALLIGKGPMLTLAGAAGSLTVKTPTAQVGAAMAVLATLEQAQVLPPEHTPEANQVIKAVIQLQSAFIKSGDPALQAFVSRAVQNKFGDAATALLATFHERGWTAGVLEALAEAEARSSPEDLHRLADGLRAFNLSLGEFHRLMDLVREATRVLARRGTTFAQVYASQRRIMPGGT